MLRKGFASSNPSSIACVQRDLMWVKQRFAASGVSFADR
jgi:hypothetical protein